MEPHVKGSLERRVISDVLAKHLANRRSEPFAEEMPSASRAEKYDAGLANQAHDRSGRAFCLMPVRAEVGHSIVAFDCPAPHLQAPQERRLFEQGVDECIQPLEACWDGVQHLLEDC